MNTTDSFGNWLRNRRKALDLTQAELADQVGCSTMTIRKIEADERRPSKQISACMADVLAISLEDRSIFINFARRVDSPALDDYNDLTPTGNLPLQATRFIGREQELAQITERLADPTCRLLTLVGPGGIGKTRLAMQAAIDGMDNYKDGVYFVSLTPVGSTTFIPAAIASALEFSFHSQDDPAAQVVNYLRGKRLLLVLDNYEHLLEGIDLLVDLLANAPRVKLLVTSRERLNVQEEWALPVAGLPYPDHGTNGETRSYSAVELFVQTARRIQPDFVLEDNQIGVIDICQAVEGMPLGIELAATWLRVMPCEQIAEQIQRDLDFLVTPLRNVEPRHQSLRAVFEHSWGLLTTVEQDVLAKLSVFRGGCDAEAAEVIAGARLSLLAGLVDKSLVRVNAAGRYEMHELLRQFTADKLLEAKQVDETRSQHLDHYLCLAEQLERRLFGPQGPDSMDRYEIEHDNCRAALDWAALVGDVESGLRLASALGWFWDNRTYWTEGCTWLETFRAMGGNASPSARARALFFLLEINQHFHDKPYIDELAEEALTLVANVDDLRTRAWLLNGVGHGVFLSSPRGTEYMEAGLVLFRALGDQWGICLSLSRLGRQAFQWGDFDRAGELQDAGIKIAREAGDKSVLARLLSLAGCKNWYEGKIDQRTEQLYEESLALCRELGYVGGIMLLLCQLGKFARLRGEDERARTLFEKSLLLAQQKNDKGILPLSLINLAAVLSVFGEAARGVQILGAVSDQVQIIFAGSSFSDKEGREDYERALAAGRDRLHKTAFAAAFAEGQRMSLDDAVAFALANPEYHTLEERSVPHGQRLVDPLTPRELEVLWHMSEGLTNQEIADQLVIGVSTVKKHVSHIYSKLDVRDRINAINRARALDLLPVASVEM